jgi:hypothetical protein
VFGKFIHSPYPPKPFMMVANNFILQAKMLWPI